MFASRFINTIFSLLMVTALLLSSPAAVSAKAPPHLPKALRLSSRIRGK
jgi:hypothetical protein